MRIKKSYFFKHLFKTFFNILLNLKRFFEFGGRALNDSPRWLPGAPVAGMLLHQKDFKNDLKPIKRFLKSFEIGQIFKLLWSIFGTRWKMDQKSIKNGIEKPIEKEGQQDGCLGRPRGRGVQRGIAA